MRRVVAWMSSVACLAGCPSTVANAPGDASVDGADMDVCVVSAAGDGSLSSGTQRSCLSARVAGCGTVNVAGATFTMGDPSALEGAPTQPSIAVGAFVMDTYEVTVARFRRYWEAGRPSLPCEAVAYPGVAAFPAIGFVREPYSTLLYGDCNWGASAGPYEAHPINCVDWYTAQAFCVWDGGRLPTEAEWELAARGTDGRPWPWGAIAVGQQVCWGGRSPAPARTCPEEDPAFASGTSPVGAWNMVGNVWEWAADNWSGYRFTTCWNRPRQTDPLCNSAATGNRVARGGCWNDTNAASVRAGARYVFAPIPDARIGFRCVRGR